MKRWEYKVIHDNINIDFEPRLNKLGEEGWELVSIIGTPRFKKTAWFKKRIPE